MASAITRKWYGLTKGIVLCKSQKVTHGTQHLKLKIRDSTAAFLWEFSPPAFTAAQYVVQNCPKKRTVPFMYLPQLPSKLVIDHASCAGRNLPLGRHPSTPLSCWPTGQHVCLMKIAEAGKILRNTFTVLDVQAAICGGRSQPSSRFRPSSISRHVGCCLQKTY